MNSENEMIEEQDGILFKNVHTRPKQMFQEMLFCHYFKQPIPLLLHCMLILSLIYHVAHWILHGAPNTAIVTPFFYAFLVAVLYILHILQVRISYKRELEISPTPIQYTLYAKQDRLSVVSDLGTNIDFEYTVIKKALKSKHYVFLITKAKHAIVVEKNGFSKGTYENFLVFLRDKNIKI